MKTSIPDRMAEATLELLQTHAWRTLDLDLVARTARVAPTSARRAFPSTASLIPAIVGLLDSRVRKALPPADPKLSTHDLLFDALMTRFEVMEDYRPAMAQLADYCRKNPEEAFLLSKALHGSISEAIAYAQKKKGKWPPSWMAHALLLLFGKVFFVWLRDCSKDKSVTLARLSNALQHFEKLAKASNSPHTGQ